MLLGESNRDVSTYLQNYGLIKFWKGITDEEVDFLKFFFFSSLFCKVLRGKQKFGTTKFRELRLEVI